MLPHIVLTSDVNWDPNFADQDVSLPTPDPMLAALPMPVAVNTTCHHDTSPIKDELDPVITINRHWIEPSNHNFKAYSKYFLGAPIATIQRTFQATTQFARSGWLTGLIFDTHKAPFPALNVHGRNEPVATDTIYADVPAIDNGSLVAQFFCGTESHCCDIYGVQTDGDVATVLMDNICKHGAMDLLISDQAQAEISNKVKDILRHLCIDDWHSEPH